MANLWQRLLGTVLLLSCCSSTRGDDLALVRQLGDASFTVREQAYQALLARGAAARLALDIGVAVADSEVRIRCRELLARITDSQLDARMKAFLEGQADLAGWRHYRDVIAGGERARFLELYRFHKVLFETIEQDPKEALKHLLAEAQAMKERFLSSPKSWRLPELTGLTLAATDARIHLDAANFTTILETVDAVALWHTVREKIAADVPARAALVEFANKLPDAATQHTMLALFFKLELRDGLPFARRCLADAAAMPTAKATALMLLGRLGDRNDVPAVTACLGDTGVVGQRQLRKTQLSTQVRDVALAMAVHLSGDEPAAYGFPYLRSLPSPLFSYQPTCFGFANAGDRTAAHERWTKRNP